MKYFKQISENPLYIILILLRILTDWLICVCSCVLLRKLHFYLWLRTGGSTGMHGISVDW